MAMLGGAGTIMGPVIGAAILIPISEVTRVWLGYKGTGVDMMLYGALIMLISAYQPQGVWGFLTAHRKEGEMSDAAPASRSRESPSGSAA